MSDHQPELEVFRAIRKQTLALVAGLDDSQAAWRPSPERWSVGEVLDHLRLFDALFVREIDELFDRAQRESRPLLRRSLRELGFSVPFVPAPLQPLIELPLSVFSTVVPEPLQLLVFRSRAVPAEAPSTASPERGRPLGQLGHELLAFFARLDALIAAHPQLDLRRLTYLQPLVGLKNVPAMLTFLGNHELRHQAQLRDILATEGFPSAAEPESTRRL